MGDYGWFTTTLSILVEISVRNGSVKCESKWNWNEIFKARREKPNEKLSWLTKHWTEFNGRTSRFQTTREKRDQRDQKNQRNRRNLRNKNKAKWRQVKQMKQHVWPVSHLRIINSIDKNITVKRQTQMQIKRLLGKKLNLQCSISSYSKYLRSKYGNVVTFHIQCFQ